MCNVCVCVICTQILIHSPADWPDETHQTLLVSTNTLETISVRPIVLTTSDDLIPWSPDVRRCYFQNEKKLKFFKVYTQKNCIFECRSINILAQCGCVPFNYISMDMVFFKNLFYDNVIIGFFLLLLFMPIHVYVYRIKKHSSLWIW